MSLDGYEKYGKTFLETFMAQSDYPIYVYSEDPLPVNYRLLHNDDDWVEFQKNPDDPPDWRYQAKRFSHKVFAKTKPEDYDWWIWLDADVEVFDAIDKEFMSLACPEWATLSYLGRKDCRTSECGWVAYNLNNGGREFLEEFRRMYVDNDVYTHTEWHDSYIFDRVREKMPGKYFNLSDGEPGMHVWDATVLGTKMRHLKGPLRKAGKSLDALPQEYRSVIE